MSDVVSIFEKRLKEALEGPEPPNAAILKVALEYILKTKFPADGKTPAGSGFKEDEDE
jgi:hypothetical protein